MCESVLLSLLLARVDALRPLTLPRDFARSPPPSPRGRCDALVDVIAYQWGITYHVIGYYKLSHGVIVYYTAVSLV